MARSGITPRRAHGRTRWLAVVAALSAAGLSAQQPQRSQNPDPKPAVPQGPEVPVPQDPDRPRGAIDEARTAADILHERLGLDRGPGELPPLPPPPPLIWQRPDQDPKPRPTQPEPPGTTLPTAPRSAAVDPTDIARRAVERLVPNTVAPPVPDPSTGAVAELPRDASQAGAGVPTLTEAVPDRFSGSLRLRYRSNNGGGSDNQDVVGLLSMTLGDASRDPVTATILGRGFADLDGRDNGIFAGLEHSFGDTVQGRLLTAHVDAPEPLGLRVARAGRQNLVQAPIALTFDGVRLETERARGSGLWAGVYGGIPVHFFESSARGDLVVGGAAGLRPWDGARVRFDAIHLEDSLLGSPARRDLLLGASWWQSVSENAQLRGEHTWLDGNPRDLVLGLDATTDAEHAFGPWTVRGTYRELLTAQRAQVTELDPYFAIGSQFEPYRQGQLDLSRAWGEHVVLAGGLQVRQLRDDGVERAFNREFERYYFEPSIRDLGFEGWSGSIVLERWETGGEDLYTIGGELSMALGAGVSLRVSSAYQLYSFDTLLGRERDHVRTWQVGAEYRGIDGMTLDASYAHERDDFSTYDTFRMMVSWQF